MSIIITIIHVIVCLLLIIIVLLQSGKGSDLASAFGGGNSNTVFGSLGAASALNKITTIIAILFMLTSLGLAILSGIKPDSVLLDSIPEEETVKVAPTQKVSDEKMDENLNKTPEITKTEVVEEEVETKTEMNKTETIQSEDNELDLTEETNDEVKPTENVEIETENEDEVDETSPTETN